MIILEAKNLKKIYQMGESEVHALKDVSISIEKGEFVAITGTSGSGKSTLMHLLGCLDIPTEGEYLIDNKNVSTMNRDELAHIRNEKIGFVFQKFFLLPDLTATDNVALPQLYAGVPENEARDKAKKLLTMVDLNSRLDHYPYQLSGGQQQRVAVARSLINEPAIILADEPTGNLDTQTGDTIMELFSKLNKENNVTIIIVTHESEIAQKTNRIIQLLDGKIISDKKIR
ncbi:ABC transporter ATP-binding protein [Candidatus Dependentiae bacterium]|nr:ABC transporter ATP-binding protein [Candidatus Dependentiae bacterium]MBU4386988.1 ABC transporter ATP-binding protein [Candidatus Dependentiae bacterium]MCG2756116.1 ABC transporter ATP-binding protein [Candidatus Dependentiae bacterium]